MSKMNNMINKGYEALKDKGYNALKSVGAGAIALSIAAGAVGGLEGCVTARSEAMRPGGQIAETYIPTGPASLKINKNPYIAERQRGTIGEQMAKQLENEFDKVEWSLMEYEEFGMKYQDLVLTGYNSNKYGDWAEWSVNFDKACRSFHQEKNFLFMHIKDHVIVEDSMGSVVKSPNLKNYIAKQLNQVLGVYIQNNQEACRNWQNFINSTAGPTGPSGK
ncbi:hypothetical protein HN695_05965 [Candidatus Woesearchaeota archaeon]|jgi:hypothetical protein|nr:hypothetical protein [Candidatus Woesearchaeota archaeon]MBT5272573.1 hypothetical protein [Candidatus Woesearchaeota archaeon]MBT6040570.1 hypothetical protein [Candidatus Woesearchaeota archaeon]MBT6337125.1 hypothetical protein [Candidatus Woesearchaeota archaeon]MBT7927855.1 hypothetical protein [Candidatus Woesearchaeota archaeon]